MKVVRLSGAQTNSLEAMGVDVSADVLIPASKDKGLYSYCDHCFYQRYKIEHDRSEPYCANPIVTHGLLTCFHMSREGKLDVVSETESDKS